LAGTDLFVAGHTTIALVVGGAEILLLGWILFRR
jgi:hypothetical protein